MKLMFRFEEKDVRALKGIVDQQSKRSFVTLRVQRNVQGDVPEVNEDSLWNAHMMCLLTTQQRSGPGKPVYRFLGQMPFPLPLERCRKEHAEAFILSCLSSFRGIRFSPKISKQAAANLERLERGEWKSLARIAERLRAQRSQQPKPEDYMLEREAAVYVNRSFKGFGPKQSRNFWQSLGLTRYEFVLDSRILRWLHKLDVPFPLTSAGLGDEEYYCWVSDMLRDLCVEARILPCVFDAAVFASYDTEEWPAEMSVW